MNDRFGGQGLYRHSTNVGDRSIQWRPRSANVCERSETAMTTSHDVRSTPKSHETKINLTRTRKYATFRTSMTLTSRSGIRHRACYVYQQEWILTQIKTLAVSCACCLGDIKRNPACSKNALHEHISRSSVPCTRRTTAESAHRLTARKPS